MLRKLGLFISVLGLLISLYLTYEKFTGGNLICGISSCNVVNNSEYSTIYGLPVSLFGVIYYSAMLTLLYVRKYRVFFLLSLVGICVSAYLTYLEAFVINAWCQWCVVSAWLVCCQGIIGYRLYWRSKPRF